MKPDDIEEYIQVRAGQTYENVRTLEKKEKLEKLTPCYRGDNSTFTNLTIEIENNLFKKNPHCINRALNYTL